MTARKEQGARIFSKTVQVLGAEVSAREWLGQLAFGLDRQMPAKLIRTFEGLKLVHSYLDQVEHDVYP